MAGGPQKGEDGITWYATIFEIPVRSPVRCFVGGRLCASIPTLAAGMAKTRLEVIQDDILAVKYALANNISFEGLEGDQLNAVLSTLFVQRAAAATASGNGSGSGSGSGSGNSNSNSTSAISRAPVNGARPKASGTKKSAAKSPKAPAKAVKTLPTPAKPVKTPAKPVKAAPKVVNASPQNTPPNEVAAPDQQPASPPAQELHRRPSSSGKPAKKPRTAGSNDRLRQMRKSITVGDRLSVLMDVSLRGSWEKVWVEGEVVREVRQTGRTVRYARREVVGGVRKEFHSYPR